VQLYSQAGFLFANRLFNPRREDPSILPWRLVDLVEQRGTLWATATRRELRPFLEARYRCTSFGLLERITRMEDAPLPHAELVDRAARLLDRHEAFPRPHPWESLRKRMVFAACETLEQAGRGHRAFEGEPACRLVRAAALARRGELREAGDLYASLVRELPGYYLTPQQWQALYLDWLRAEWGLVTGAEVVTEQHRIRLAQAVARSASSLAIYPACHAELADALLRLALEGPFWLHVPLEKIERNLGHCPGVAARLAAVRVRRTRASPPSAINP
jgi:hypothetical protein